MNGTGNPLFTIDVIKDRFALLVLKRGVWMYIVLLLIEGGLRKWIFPSLATPLLIVRDPLALWLLFYSINKGYLKGNIYIFIMLVISITGLYTAVLFGHENLYVAVYGMRIFILHFPLIFVIGSVFDATDVQKVGIFLLWVSLPMTILMVVQFYSPQFAVVNRGVGGDIEGGGFNGGALGYFRPPGTFSFISGLTNFYGLVAAFVFYYWLHAGLINKFLLISSTCCLFAAIPYSISRTLLFEVLLSLSFTIVIGVYRPNYIRKLGTSFLIISILVLIIGYLGFFDIGLDVFLTRFNSANESEGGAKGVFIDRFLGGMIGAVTDADSLPFWGYGIGMGTNVGAMLLAGKTSFLIAEVEWGRLIGEMGILLGTSAIIARVLYSIRLLVHALKLVKLEKHLPWMLLSFGFIQILQGQWAQPTNLGFSILAGGLVQASFHSHITSAKG